MIVLLDNYDSFVYNLARYLRELGEYVRVIRNDAAEAGEVLDLEPTHLVVSPGPCTPSEAGIANDLIRASRDTLPTLGVCLGHQCIADALGAEIVRADRPMHGKVSRIEHGGVDLFAGLPSPLRGVRYHSLVVEEESLPGELEVTARAVETGEVMALRHRERQLWGVQFHPEAVLTERGHVLLRNFLALGRGENAPGAAGEDGARELEEGEERKAPLV